jgi:NAD(P)H-dependent flavin oxidoreductase YrpB (nitropropane dioxygenase family)
MKKSLVLLCVMALFTGCIAVSEARYDSVKRKSKDQIEVFAEGKKPTKPYKEIATYSAGGKPFDVSKAHARFISKAKAIGADGIILKPTAMGGNTGPFGVQELSFQGVAFVYE